MDHVDTSLNPVFTTVQGRCLKDSDAINFESDSDHERDYIYCIVKVSLQKVTLQISETSGT